MSRHTPEVRVDGLTSEPAGGTVRFRLDGRTYEADLTAADAKNLRQVIHTHVSAGHAVRPVGFPRLRRFVKDYLSRGEAASITDARAGLLTPGTGPQIQDDYLSVILEQYKIYVEMADRISARRALANTFFLTLNSAIFTLIGVFWKDHPSGDMFLLALPTLVLVTQCLAWFWLLRSYRQLNSGKYAVIGALEELLPASPYWRSEWRALGQGEDKSKYWPLTHVEQWVPLLFALAYAGGFLSILLSGAP